jgi:hypothetical protein
MLPKIDTPIYDLTLPLSKKKIRFRPFLVKEEKILLMAIESEDENSMLLAIEQIVNNCCLNKDFDVESLPLSDLEFLFLNLRARSVGEVVELQYKCNNKPDKDSEEECGHLVKFDLNLLEVQPEIPKDHSQKIELTPTMGIVMKYPSMKLMGNLTGTEIEKLMNLLIACIDYIYDEEQMYYAKDQTKQELTDFVESLNRIQFAELQKFFESLPKIKKELHFHCDKCNYDENIFVEGLQNFFV